MKKNSKSLVIFCVMFFLMTGLPAFVMAQGALPDGGAVDPDAPIDGGISLLVAAGIGYGVKKARDNRKKNVANLL